MLRESNPLANEQQVVDKGKGKTEGKIESHVLRPATNDPSRAAALFQSSKRCAEYPKLLHTRICGVDGVAAGQRASVECNLSGRSGDSAFAEEDDEEDESEKREEDVTFDDSLQSPLDVLLCFIANCISAS